MTKFNTGNAVPSTDARDLYDNAQNLDEAVNSDSTTFTDRQGNSRLTIQGMVDAATSGNPAVGAAQQALASADKAKTEANRAESEATIAESARDAATINADVYTDTASGLAGTSVGDQFQVAGGDEIIRYRHDSGPVATEVARYPSSFLRGLAVNSPNLFDKLDPAVLIDTRIITSNGDTLGAAGINTTPYIPVAAGQDYTFATRHNSAWYDSSKVYISGVADSAVNTLTAPAGAAFLRTGWDVSEVDIDSYWIVEGNQALEAYRPYGVLTNKDRTFNLGPESIRKKSLTSDVVAFSESGKNLFDKDAVLSGYYMNAAGALTADATYAVSDFIPVQEGETYSGVNPGGTQGMRFVTAFDAGKGVLSGSGSNSELTSLTVPAGVAFYRVTVRVSALNGFQFEKGGPTVWTPFGDDLSGIRVGGQSLLEPGPQINRAVLRRSRLKLFKLSVGDTDQLNILAVGDSYTQNRYRWPMYFTNRLIQEYGDGGGGWTGYGYGGSYSGPYVIGGTQPSLINGNVRDTYPVRYAGAWTCTYIGSISPDMAYIESSTVGDLIERDVPATPDHTALRLFWIATADGEIRYRIDGGAWTNVNTTGVVGELGTTDIALTTGAHTVEIEVVAGTVQLCGDDALSDASGVRFHKCAASGSRMGQYTGVDSTDQIASWALLSPDAFVLMDGANSQGANVAPSAWSADLQEMITRFRGAGSAPDILLVTPPENQRTSNLVAIRAYHDVARPIAETEDVALLDLQSYFGRWPSDYADGSNLPLFSSDEIHPVPETGGRIMSSAILDMVKPK